MSIPPLILFEDPGWRRFGPVAHLRPVWDLRIGLQTLGERISTLLDVPPQARIARSSIVGLLGEMGTGQMPVTGDVFLVNGRFAGEPFTEGLAPDCPATVWTDGPDVAAARLPVDVARRWFSHPVYDPLDYTTQALLSAWNTVQAAPEVRVLEARGSLIWWPWDLLERQSGAIEEQFALLGAALDGEIDHRAILVDESRMHVAKGASVRAGAILDASGGPILLEERVEIMPGAIVMGPVALASGTKINAGAKLHGPVVAGPKCKLGGEIEETLIQGHSNKQHDGYLGHAVLGEWVNLGADTNNSDLKNNYSNVSVRIDGEEIDTGRLFFGCLIGDHVKTAINTQLNTGTVIGIGSNIYGSDFPPKEIGAFRWGGAAGFEYYDFERFIETARRVMERRDVNLTPAMILLLRELHAEALEGRL
ncbi:MAG: putative sugar nucleotidyl transferase [bacterium]